MALQVQAMMGQGSRKRKADQMTAGPHLLGNSLKTRMLFSVLLGRLCSGQKVQNHPLLALVNHLCLQLQALSRRDFSQHKPKEIENIFSPSCYETRSACNFQNWMFDESPQYTSWNRCMPFMYWRCGRTCGMAQFFLLQYGSNAHRRACPVKAWI